MLTTPLASSAGDAERMQGGTTPRGLVTRGLEQAVAGTAPAAQPIGNGVSRVVELTMPEPRDMRVKSAEFVKSSTELEQVGRLCGAKLQQSSSPCLWGICKRKWSAIDAVWAAAQCPPAKLPEFAVIGRSNVGKSSLINLLTGKKALALTSKTPGVPSLLGLSMASSMSEGQGHFLCL